ncbi:MAG TPA: TolC family protein [Polyangiales bacterium]|nr:TolC family protein [Polyangiales bacterium]
MCRATGLCLLALVSVFGLGCVPSLNQTKPREPRRELPSGFGSAAPSAGPQSAGEKKWNEFFTDPQLDSLIEAALKNNQELNIRLQEIIIAQNEVMAAKGDVLPKVDVGVGAGVDKVGKYTSQGVSDEAHELSSILQNYKFGFSAQWEVDIWKKLRNAAKSATLKYAASVEGRNFVVTQLVAEIANSYYELLALDSQLEVLKQNIAIQQNGLEVVRWQKEAGQATELGVQRFAAEVLKNQGKQYDLEQKIIEAENRINFLVGRYPQPVARNSQKFNEPLPNVLQAGVPTKLLDNRPDVKQAELALAAAKLDVEVAKARFYPALSIDAGVGYQAFNVKHLVATPESLIFNLAGNLTAPLLNRQAIKAEYFTANAQQMQAVLRYEQTVLQAFTEVANQLAMIQNLDKTYQLSSQQVERLTQAIEISNVLFQSARADYLEVLTTRRDSLDSQMELIETRLRQMHAMVNIYQALGGGWRR